MNETIEETPDNILLHAESPERKRFLEYQIELERNIQSQLQEIILQQKDIPPVLINGQEFDLFKLEEGEVECRLGELSDIILKLIRHKRFSVVLPGINMFLHRQNRELSHPEAFNFWKHLLIHFIDFTSEQKNKNASYEANMVNNDMQDPSKIPGIELTVHIGK